MLRAKTKGKSHTLLLNMATPFSVGKWYRGPKNHDFPPWGGGGWEVGGCLNGHRDLCLVTMSIWPWVVPNIHSTLKANSSHETCFSHGLTKRNEQDRGHTWKKSQETNQK